MRKTIAILLTVSLLALMLCACGGRSSQPVSMDGESYEILDTGEKNEAAGEKGQSADKKEKISKKADDLAGKLSKSTAPSVGIKTGFMFKMMSMMHTKGFNSSPIETQYWKEKGWLDGKKPY